MLVGFTSGKKGEGKNREADIELLRGRLASFVRLG